MGHHDIRSAARPEPDQAMVDIANYVTDYRIDTAESFTTARYMLLDSIGCALMAMKHPECTKHLGPLVPGATMAHGVKVPGTLHGSPRAFNRIGDRAGPVGTVADLAKCRTFT